MRRRANSSASAVGQKQAALAQQENQLRERMQELQRMIEEAPRVAEETSRRQREELVRRANQTGSRLDASISLRDKRWGDEDWGPPRRGALRKERREGRIVFIVLLIALAVVVMWLATHFHF